MHAIQSECLRSRAAAHNIVNIHRTHNTCIARTRTRARKTHKAFVRRWCDYYKLINKHIAVINLLIMNSEHERKNPGADTGGLMTPLALGGAD